MGNDRIQKFDPDGNFLAMWQTEGGGVVSRDNTHGLAISSNKIYVAVSRHSNQYYIQRYSPPLPPHFEFSPITDHAINESFSVTITAIDANGNVDTSFNGEIPININMGKASRTGAILVNGTATVSLSVDSSGKGIQLTTYAHEYGMYGESNAFNITGGPSNAVVWGFIVDANNEKIRQGLEVVVTLTGPEDRVLGPFPYERNYEFENLPPGTYTLEASVADGRISWQNTITLSNDQPKKFNLMVFEELATWCEPEGKTPVLLVPGMMGSTISTRLVPYLPKQPPTWNDPAWKTNDDYSYFGLWDKGGEVGWRNLAQILRDNGYKMGCTIFPVPYDWRMDVKQSAQTYLQPWINEAKGRTGSDKVHVVAHSMGGLVTRAYIQGDDYAGDIERFAMVGTPNHGSVNPYFLWQGGDPRLSDAISGANSRSWSPAYEAVSRVQYFLFHPYDSLPALLTSFTRLEPMKALYKKKFSEFYKKHTPSMRQLEPTFPFLSNRTLSCDPNPLLSTLNTANTRFLMGREGDANAEIVTKVFAGTGKSTTINIPAGSAKCTRTLYQDGNPDGVLLQREVTLGDGTVPVSSAYLDFADYVEGEGEHMKLINDVHLGKIFEFITGEPYLSSPDVAIVRSQSSNSNRNSSIQRLAVMVLGRSQPLLTNPVGQQLGIDMQTLSEVAEIPDGEYSTDSDGVSLSIPNPVAGDYSLTLSDAYTESYMLVLQYEDDADSFLLERFSFSHPSDITFTFTFQPSNDDKIVVNRTPAPPEDVVAEFVTSNTRISWAASTNPDVISYNVYVQGKYEPYFSLLGSTSNTYYDTGHLWSDGSSIPVRLYAVSAVTSGGDESFLSNTIENNDRDQDGLSDEEETTAGTNMDDPDSDDDGLTDGEEVWEYDTDPLLPDTDNDTYSDYAEVLNHSDPLDPASVPPFFAAGYGGTGIDEGSRILPTDDSGSILVGTTESFGVGGKDIWLLKLNTDGSIAWQKTYGGVGNEQAGMVQPTPDGGYILVGTTDSFGIEGNDLWLLKLDSLGTIEWQQTYGESYSEDTGDIVWNTDDGGYIVGGSSNSFGPSAFWLLKLDGAGAIQWENVYDKPGKGYIAALQQSIDGGYILAVNNDLEDFWVLKLDSTGGVTWQNTYSDSPQNYTDFTVDRINALQQTTDGGYIVAGSVNTAWSLDNPEEELWILKLDSSGAISWQKKYEGSGENIAYAIRQTDDGGYIVAEGDDGDMSLIKLDVGGNLSWRNTYSGASLNGPTSIRQTVDGGYLVAASSSTYGAGQSDLFVLKVRAGGTISDCAIGSPSSLQVSDTTASSVATNVSPYSTAATVTISTALSQETLIEPEYICSQPIPDMYLTQAGQSIPGDSGSYDFGTVPIGTAEPVTLTIENLGTLDLKLVGSPIIQIIGEGAEDFSIATIPASTIIPGASTTFTMQFAPTLPGSRVATVLIFNNDSNKNPYTFTVIGTGIAPEINLKQGTTSLQSGVGSYTFGTVNVGDSSSVITFTIENLGSANLTLSGIQKTGSHPNDFTVTQPVNSIVAPNGSTTFTVKFAPTMTGTRTATISIANNDSDENPYTFTVSGTGEAQASNSYLLWTK